MQNPRRPPADRRRASGARDRPISFNRRLEEAREARARVLAAREGQEGDEPPVPESGAPDVAGSGGQSGHDAAAPSQEDESPGRRLSAIPWLIAGCFLAGAAAGAVAIWVLLPWGQPTPPGAQTGTTTAPELASGAPEASTEDPAVVSEAGSEPAPVAVAADDGEGGAEDEAVTAALPEVTAADRARGGGARAVTGADDEAADRVADPVTDPAGPSRPDAAPRTHSVAEATLRADADSATSSSELSSRPSDEADDEPQGPVPLAEAAGGEGVDVTGETRGTPDVTDAEGAAADAVGKAAAAAVGTDADPAAEAAAPQPDSSPPAEDRARPSEEAEAAVGDASEEATGTAPSGVAGAAPPEAAAGAARLYVHAAPGVTSGELDDVVAGLAAAGYSIVQARRADFRISQTNVRYFHDADAELAAGVAETVSGIARDFTDYDPLPDPGTIEVWLEG